MVESGTFIHGIHIPAHTVPGKKRSDKPVDVPAQTFYGFIIAEEKFRHSLEVANDPATASLAAADPVYYQAALLACRLSVEGIARVTADMVLDLTGKDGDLLMAAVGRLEERVSSFRGAAQAAPQKAGSPAKDGD